VCTFTRENQRLVFNVIIIEEFCTFMFTQGHFIFVKLLKNNVYSTLAITLPLGMSLSLYLP